MPIARFEVRNAYGLGQPELYRNVDREDPKAVLDGVAISGLVGILRQLGDLAEFAAEIFHGIQEDVMTTASRSNKLMIRLQHVEATVPSLEKTMLAQTSHLHFAYTAGREWHPRIPNEQNHFICNDLPRFIMDSYEECRDPPRLHLLDKFDIDGPGSCLKRYSDPTYFRRASSRQIEANNDFQKDNKNRKIKKKKSLQRNRDISRLASMTTQSGRKPFISVSFGRRTSSSKTASTIDTELKSDFQDHSRSFDSRSGSGYTECHSTATSSVKTEEKPSGVLSSSSFTPGALTIASVLSECQSEDADSFSYSPSHGQAARGSSCISWDEKAEIVESNGLQRSTKEAPEMMETSFVVDASAEKPNYEGRTGRENFHVNDIETAESVSSVKQNTGIEVEQDMKAGQEIERQQGVRRELEMDSEHETESEGDTFVDALNTIESESENDCGFQTSGEEQKKSNDVLNGRLGNSKCERGFAQPCLNEQDIEHNSNNVEDGRSVDEFKGHSLGNDETTCVPSDLQENKIISRGSEKLLSTNASYELISQESGVASEKPSPRSEHSVGKDVPDDAKGAYDITSPSVLAHGDSLYGSTNTACNNGMQEHQESEAEAYDNLQPVTLWTNGSLLGLQPSIPTVFAEPKTEDAEKEKSENVVRDALQFQMVPSYTSEKASQPFVDPCANPERTFADGKAVVESHETLSGVFGLSHRLLMNGFRRKDSFAHDRKVVPTTIPENAEVTDKSGYSGQDTEEKTFEEPFRDETPFDWLTSSPPLEHMKISFNPAESLPISKLKLKVPNGVQYTFSSFQLVPEPATSAPDFDSDDDTFCRSSYMSDNDYLSDNDSVSSSKQWEESSDSPERKDQELYDSLHRSAHAAIDVAPSSLSAPSLGVPCFETLKPSLQIGTTNSSVSENLSYLQSPAEPLPPPLPPVQWRVSKPSTERFEDKQQSLQDELKRAFDKKSYLSTVHLHSCTDPVNKEQPSEVSTVPKPENNVRQTNNGREDKQNVNGKETEAGDFLHQIRTKQFNLRRVMTTRPSIAATTGPVPNTNINAILEKANSIRQAVASDDGDESDTWSDT